MVEDARKIAAEATGKYFLDIALQSAEETLADVYTRNWNFNTDEGAITTVAPYSTGTITLTNGSQTCTGSGTTWVTSWPVNAVLTPSGGNGEQFLVTAYGSATSLTIDRPFPFTTAAGQTYTLSFPSYTIAEYLRVQQVTLAQFPWYPPLQLSSMEELLYSRNLWPVTGRPCLFFVVAGDGTTSAQLVMWPPPQEVQTIRFRYTKAVPTFRCLVGSADAVGAGGVASIAAAGTALTGSNTSWLKLGYTLVGHYLEDQDQDGVSGLISAVASDTAATSGAWGGRALSGAAYYISPKILMPDDFRPMLRDLMRWKYFQNSMETDLAAAAEQRYLRNYRLAMTRINRLRGPGSVRPIDIGMNESECTEPGRPWNLVMTYSP